jgi:cytochrome c6
MSILTTLAVHDIVSISTLIKKGGSDAMKKLVLGLSILAVLGLLVSDVFAQKSSAMSLGESEFKEHCAVCHANGGNIINQKKSLHKQDREKNNIKSEADIVKNIRNPGPGMTKFDKKTISDTEAQAIAQYILKTF